MHLNRYCLRNFRRLEKVEIKLERENTIFVGANNSGKTSATAAFKLFVSKKSEFKIHDFSSPLIAELDRFGESDFESDDYKKVLPAIELDLWFTVSSSTMFGRVADLLPTLKLDYTEVGIRIRFAVKDPEALYKAYRSKYPKNSKPKIQPLSQRNRRRIPLRSRIAPTVLPQNTPQKSLSHFLSQGKNLVQYFGLYYYQLLGTEPETPSPLDKDKGIKAIESLLHIDYVEAQRNIDDDSSSRSNRLSTVFASYYKYNLSKQESDNQSIRVIDESNLNLTQHYGVQFSPLLKVIEALGFPALNDRVLRIISNLSAEEALSGNTAITYMENGTEHELPEAYNGLGYKNLIYIAVQIAHFQLQWAAIEDNRPLCQLVFIEEPEVHLHAQVQQTFIRQLRKVMEEIEGNSPDPDYVQQLVVTTHSSHIISEADFKLIRYFRRTKTALTHTSNMLIASEVLNLASFNSKDEDKDNLQFLKRYIKLTHCDLFFADAAILVEGTVERLLMPKMIQNETPELSTVYLTILELGGAYAHQFIELLKFINLPTLIITDLDSVDPAKNSNNKKNAKCRADHPNAITSNGSIKKFTRKKLISEILKLNDDKKALSKGNFQQYITFQQAVPVPCYGQDKEMIPRTFEEAFIYENIENVKRKGSKDEKKEINSFVILPENLDFDTDYEKIYRTVKANGYKKVEFALAQIETQANWITPKYIVDGLKWLRKTLKLSTESKSNNG